MRVRHVRFECLTRPKVKASGRAGCLSALPPPHLRMSLGALAENNSPFNLNRFGRRWNIAGLRVAAMGAALIDRLLHKALAVALWPSAADNSRWPAAVPRSRKPT